MSDVAQSCPTLSDPMDCSLPGSSIHGIFQARVLEWGANAFLKSVKISPPAMFFFIEDVLTKTPLHFHVSFRNNLSSFILKYPIGILTELALQWGNNDIVNIEFSSS